MKSGQDRFYFFLASFDIVVTLTVTLCVSHRSLAHTFSTLSHTFECAVCLCRNCNQDLRLFSIIAVVPHFFIIINVLFSSFYSILRKRKSAQAFPWYMHRHKTCIQQQQQKNRVYRMTACYEHRFSSRSLAKYIGHRQTKQIRQKQNQQKNRKTTAITHIKQNKVKAYPAPNRTEKKQTPYTPAI